MHKPDLAVALNEIERRLRARRAALAESLGPGGSEDEDPPRSPRDDVARAPETVEGGTDLSVVDGARRELAAIDAALDGLARGVYGACRDCGRPIEPTRVLTAPLAERCTACHSRRERAGSRPPSSTMATPRPPVPGPAA